MTVAARGISNQYTQVLGDNRQWLYQASAEICFGCRKPQLQFIRKIWTLRAFQFPRRFSHRTLLMNHTTYGASSGK